MAPLSPRSLLFVPGDRPDRMRKALASGADALILDLEDAVAPSAKADARREIATFLRSVDREVALFVRINSLTEAAADLDLDAVIPESPSAIMLPKAEGSASIADLEDRLRLRGDKDTMILPIATETPRAVFKLGEYVEASGRLVGLTWGSEDLPAAVGARGSRRPDGTLTPPYEVARALTLFAAAAAGVHPIETVFSAVGDLDGLKSYADRAAHDGFTGMMAIHPVQVPVINRAFSPSAVNIAQAKSVVAAFDANPGAGVLVLDGKMIDGPHLRRARTLLARVEQ